MWNRWEYHEGSIMNKIIILLTISVVFLGHNKCHAAFKCSDLLVAREKEEKKLTGFAQDYEKLTFEYKKWIKDVKAKTLKILEDDATCLRIKNRYKRYKKKEYKQKVEWCDNAYNADRVKRFEEVYLDYTYMVRKYPSIEADFYFAKDELNLLDTKFRILKEECYKKD